MIPSLALIGTTELILIVVVVGALALTGLGTVAIVVWAVTRSKSGTTAKVEGLRVDGR